MSYADFARQTFENMLGTLDHLTERAIAADVGDDILAARLVDDMFPLELQFRVAINQVLLALQQVGGAQVPLEDHRYETLADVRTGIARVRRRLSMSTADDWQSPESTVDLTLPNNVRFVMSAEADIRDWILPNFYFHVSIAYALLRLAGVDIGKMDLLPHMARHLAPSEPKTDSETAQD